MKRLRSFATLGRVPELTQSYKGLVFLLAVPGAYCALVWQSLKEHPYLLAQLRSFFEV